MVSHLIFQQYFLELRFSEIENNMLVLFKIYKPENDMKLQTANKLDL